MLRREETTFQYEVRGRVERVGTLGAGEFTSRTVILIEGHPLPLMVFVDRNQREFALGVCLTAVGDEVVVRKEPDAWCVAAQDSRNLTLEKRLGQIPATDQQSTSLRA